MNSVESEHSERAAIETKFIRMSEPVEVGSSIDGWKVAWCMPDQNRVIWHVMVLRPYEPDGLLPVAQEP